MCCVADGNAARTTDNENRKITDLQDRRLNHNLRTGAWCSGITSASHAEGPGLKSQCVHFEKLFGRIGESKRIEIPPPIRRDPIRISPNRQWPVLQAHETEDP